jgi:putative aldouronate transport system substrate-binding protein
MKTNQRISVKRIAATAAAVLMLASCGANQPAATTNPPPLSSETGEVPVVKFTMFQSGYSISEDINDNEIQNFIREQTGLDFEVVEKPSNADVETRFEMLMASGNIPDVVQYITASRLRDYAELGAWYPMDESIAASPALSGLYNEVQLNSTRSKDGKVYVLPALPNEFDGNMWIARMDLLEEAGYNYETLNEEIRTPDDLLEAGRKVKAIHPDLVPFVSPAMTGWSEWMTWPFNTRWYGWLYYPESNGGEARSAWADGNILKCLEWANRLYEEGLLDREFPTKTRSDTSAMFGAGNVLVHAIGTFGLMSFYTDLYQAGVNDVQLVDLVPVVAEDVGITQFQNWRPISGGWGIAVNAKVDGQKFANILKYLEYIAADEGFQTRLNYGVEGQDYTVVDGQKRPTETWMQRETDGEMQSHLPLVDMNLFHINNYELFQIFAYQNAVDNENAVNSGLSKEARIAKYDKTFDSYLRSKPITRATRGYNALELAPPLDDAMLNRVNQLAEEQRALCMSVILGELSLEDFDVERQRILAENEDITAAYQELAAQGKARGGL